MYYLLLPSTCSGSGTLLPIYSPGVSEADEEGREHTTWNPKALSNWVICFGIHLDSCIITFFLFYWIIPISKQTCNNISHFKKKVHPWPQITSSFCLITLLLFRGEFKSWLYSLSLLPLLPFSFPSGFISAMYPEKLFSLTLPNPMCGWLMVLIDLDCNCQGWSLYFLLKSSPLWIAHSWLSSDLLGLSVLADSSSPSRSLTVECWAMDIFSSQGHSVRHLIQPSGFGYHLYTMIPKLISHPWCLPQPQPPYLAARLTSPLCRLTVVSSLVY